MSLNNKSEEAKDQVRQLEQEKQSILRDQRKCKVIAECHSINFFQTEHEGLNQRAKKLQQRRATWQKTLREMRDVQESEIRYTEREAMLIWDRKEKEEKIRRIEAEKAKIAEKEEEIREMKAALDEKEGGRRDLQKSLREAEEVAN